MARGWAVLWLISLFALVGLPARAATPRHVVSLSPCLDAILLAVADPDQITALSHYSREPSQSAVSAEARRYPFTWGSAEEIVALRPDLVLTSGTGDAALTGVLPGLGIRQASFQVPATVAQSLAQIDRISRLVGHPERGAALIAKIQVALARAAPRPGEPRLAALVYESHGMASGPDTLMDEMLRRTGFVNLASRYGLMHTGDVPLDSLIADPPQVLLEGRLGPNEPVWADRILSNPALHALARDVRVETFPDTLMFCGGPTLAPAAMALAQARENALRGISR